MSTTNLTNAERAVLARLVDEYEHGKRWQTTGQLARAVHYDTSTVRAALRYLARHELATVSDLASTPQWSATVSAPARLAEMRAAA
jgi:hypothetical protein